MTDGVNSFAVGRLSSLVVEDRLLSGSSLCYCGTFVSTAGGLRERVALSWPAHVGGTGVHGVTDRSAHHVNGASVEGWAFS